RPGRDTGLRGLRRKPIADEVKAGGAGMARRSPFGSGGRRRPTGRRARGSSGAPSRPRRPPGAPRPPEGARIGPPRERRLSGARLRRVLTGAARALDVSGSVALLLTGDAMIRRLNARYRHKDRPTDVLSFPGPGGDEGLGDIVISVATAARNARGLGR